MKHRSDQNQANIVAAFERLGCSVMNLSQVGNGCPDILVSVAGGGNHLVEIKSHDGKLRGKQLEFASRWKAPVYICRSASTAYCLVQHWRGERGEVEVV